jgi:hypothetical protein
MYCAMDRKRELQDAAAGLIATKRARSCEDEIMDVDVLVSLNI